MATSRETIKKQKAGGEKDAESNTRKSERERQYDYG